MPDPQVWEGLKGMGAWWAGKGPSYEVAKTNRLEQEQEQEQLRKREKVISALTVYDVLKGEGPRGAAAFLQDRINRGAQEGQDVSQMEDMYREILSMKTPDDLKSALQDGARLQREAQMRGWMDAPAQPSPHTNIKILEDGTAAGYNPQTGAYERLQGPEGARFQQGGQHINVNTGPNLSPGREAVDKAYADKYLEWRTMGGVDSASQMAQIAKALQEMEGAIGRGEELSGPVIGAIPRGLRAMFDPQGLNVQEQVEEVVQRNLRAVLGAQFAEKEGERLISRAYNPQLDTRTNMLRVQKLFEGMSQVAAAQEAIAQYFEENGTLMGYRGPTVNIGALYEAVGAAPNPQASEEVFRQQLQFLSPEQQEQAKQIWSKLSQRERVEYMKRMAKR